MLWWIATTALSSTLPAAPMVTVDWAGDAATLAVWTPLGFELAEDAPAVVELSWADQSLRWESTGAALTQGVALGEVRGQALTGRLTVSLCDKKAGTCAPSAFSLDGWAAERRKGQAILKVEAAAPAAGAPAHRAGPAYQTDAAAIAADAFAAASADGKRVILDFGAVWCPPCNLLSAQVFHALDAPGVLEEYHLAVLDVDDPRSFELKDRYAVGGYPTVVIAEADGTEISRQVGYPGREEVVGWLTRAAEQAQPDTDFTLVDPATVEPSRAAEIAWLLVQADKDPTAWIGRAKAATDSVELHLARVAHEPTLEDAQWLAANAPGTAVDWVYPAKALGETDAGRAVLRQALEADLHSAAGADAADLLYLLAETAREADQPLFYAAAAASLRSALTGDPDRDRGHYTWLAVLTERSGDLDGAIALLTESAERWPTEPTFYLALASTWLRNGRPEDSLVAANTGMAASWGDNQLRMAEAACKALGALDRRDEAKALADKTLAEIPPAEDLAVRTGRYREKLQAWVDGTAE